MTDFLSASRARAAVAAGPVPGSMNIAPGLVGQPVLVHTASGAPSYWLVPLEQADRVIGFARVNSKGRVIAAGNWGPRHERTVVTGITSEEAASAAIIAKGGELATSPIYIHDGPIGREGWLVRLRSTNGDIEVIVTPGGVATLRSRTSQPDDRST